MLSPAVSLLRQIPFSLYFSLYMAVCLVYSMSRPAAACPSVCLNSVMSSFWNAQLCSPAPFLHAGTGTVLRRHSRTALPSVFCVAIPDLHYRLCSASPFQNCITGCVLRRHTRTASPALPAPPFQNCITGSACFAHEMDYLPCSCSGMMMSTTNISPVVSTVMLPPYFFTIYLTDFRP